MKSRRELLVASLAVLAPITSYAQSVGRVRRIGVLGNVAPPANAGSPIQVFIATLRDLGVTPALRAACESDVRRLCIGSNPSVQKVKACVAHKFTQLGRRCQMELASAGFSH